MFQRGKMRNFYKTKKQQDKKTSMQENLLNRQRNDSHKKKRK